ncbi:MAG: rRNA methyltransferase, partial [Actinobacteria bacterium]|nr:rRNA methyltransferase [Actinomycetota bacterium]
SAADPRLDAFRWRDRQLASKLDRLDAVGAGLFIAEGDLVVQRAIDMRYHAVSLLCESATGSALAALIDESVDIFIASEEIRGEVTGLGVPLRATGLFRRPALLAPHELLASASRLVVAEDIDNPTNLGAIVRSAAALGWDGILLAPGSADPLARRALRVSMGSGLSMPFARLSRDDNVNDLLQQHNYMTVALTPDSNAVKVSDIAYSVQQKMALMFGSERDGLRTDTMASSSVVARIPMYGDIDSLNVGAAAAIAMYALGPDNAQK